MQTNENAVVLGEVTDVLLWGFKLELTDRRTGERLEGYAVETGNEDYELDDAAQSIRNRFGAMGYSVNSCTFDTERKYTYDAVKEFEAAEPTNSVRILCILSASFMNITRTSFAIARNILRRLSM